MRNIARYAQAPHVDIILKIHEKHVNIDVRDNGSRFDMGMIPDEKAFGLMGMTEQALVAHGKVEIGSQPGQGTVVFIEIPLCETPGGKEHS